MPLSNDRYIIRSGDGSNRPIGVSKNKVVVLAEDDLAPQWIFETKGSRYYIKTPDGQAIVYKDNKLWISDDEGEKWHFESAFHHGRNIYVIQAEDKNHGWYNPLPEDGNQLNSRPLIIGPSFPPFFPPIERFIIERVQE
ncbi:hypothetical protein AAF712_002884 [Marasmius tenuissimus]|uniref:Uncharacterized protein n=1 Tax=Marasmius tenuissimus TaxID=585030 RepID=A0ABR3ABP1_9AGAR|nr:hypothetical protein PM082_000440 [Marasmius tenuissimus]